METIQVLDKGFVRLDASCADDLSVVNAARVSFKKRHEAMESGDDKLIEYLMRNEHGTPFEHNFMCFEVKAPIMVFREWHRHRIGISINEQSARYMEMEREFYIPTNVRKQIGKPGHYEYVVAEPELMEICREELEKSCNIAFNTYEHLLRRGVAKEQARDCLPFSTYSTMIWSCNARSLMAFLHLRNAMTAMWEIQQYAAVLEDIWATLMPVTHAAFIANGRKAP